MIHPSVLVYNVQLPKNLLTKKEGNAGEIWLLYQ